MEMSECTAGIDNCVYLFVPREATDNMISGRLSIGTVGLTPPCRDGRSLTVYSSITRVRSDGPGCNGHTGGRAKCIKPLINRKRRRLEMWQFWRRIAT